MTIGEKIKRLRKECGMTQEELGNLVGVQKAAINKYETGVVVNLKKEMISKLAAALDVNPVWLMDEEDDWPPVPSTKTLIARAFAEDQAKKQAEELGPPKTPEARILARGIDKLPQAQREQALAVVRAMFAAYADFFDSKETDDHDSQL